MKVFKSIYLLFFALNLSLTSSLYPLSKQLHSKIQSAWTLNENEKALHLIHEVEGEELWQVIARARAHRVEEAWKILNTYLHDREEVNELLDQAFKEYAWAVIEDSYYKSEDRFRIMILSQLQRVSDPRAIPIIKEGLSSSNLAVRYQALESCFSYPDAEIKRAVLSRWLIEGNALLRTQMLKLAARFNWEEFGLWKSWMRTKTHYFFERQALLEANFSLIYQEVFTDQVLDLIKDPNHHLRQMGLSVLPLTNLSLDAIQELYLNHFKDDYPDILYTSLYHSSLMGSCSFMSQDKYHFILNHYDPNIRLMASWAMMRLFKSDAKELLRIIYDEKKGLSTRLFAIQLLGSSSEEGIKEISKIQDQYLQAKIQNPNFWLKVNSELLVLNWHSFFSTDVIEKACEGLEELLLLEVPIIWYPQHFGGSPVLQELHPTLLKSSGLGAVYAQEDINGLSRIELIKLLYQRGRVKVKQELERYIEGQNLLHRTEAIRLLISFGTEGINPIQEEGTSTKEKIFNLIPFLSLNPKEGKAKLKTLYLQATLHDKLIILELIEKCAGADDLTFLIEVGNEPYLQLRFNNAFAILASLREG